ncbi:OmpP1/FadL family transporter [Sulfuricurvum sp.]|uniref:OmpP1/FadL family transporter n=1 Tax=Sulfuricurvum sp. TaxID=2025608 RepID=UPI0035676A08
MKRSIKLAVAAAVALTSTAAFATNGDAMIGVGAKAVGMGGVGIGMSHGAESALTNPAMITAVEGTEISFGGTVFMPDVKTNIGQGETQSAAKLSVIPSVAIAQKATDNFYWGIGMYGVAGMGTDYRGTNNNYSMVTNLQLMQFVVPLAYKINGFSVGVAPILQYGSLDINYNTTGTPAGGSTTKGVAQDFGVGYNLGVAYETSGVTVGASYKSAINMKYDGQLSNASKDFGLNNGAGLSDNLQQPAEIGVGASYKMDQHTFAADYKKIKWSSANGYKDFKWDDQNVYMIGYQFSQDNWALRAGYNYAKSPITAQPAANMMTPGNYDGAALNTLNLLGFPAIIQTHYTVGGSYSFTKATSFDLAYVYSPKVTDTYDTSAMTQAMIYRSTGTPSAATSSVTTSHSQKAVTAQLNFKF